MYCPNCRHKIVTKADTKGITLTKAQFNKLKEGSVIKTIKGEKRPIVSRDRNFIRVESYYTSDNKLRCISYCYSDISRRYKVIKY